MVYIWQIVACADGGVIDQVGPERTRPAHLFPNGGQVAQDSTAVTALAAVLLDDAVRVRQLVAQLVGAQWGVIEEEAIVANLVVAVEVARHSAACKLAPAAAGWVKVIVVSAVGVPAVEPFATAIVQEPVFIGMNILTKVAHVIRDIVVDGGRGRVAARSWSGPRADDFIRQEVLEALA